MQVRLSIRKTGVPQLTTATPLPENGGAIVGKRPRLRCNTIEVGLGKREPCGQEGPTTVDRTVLVPESYPIVTEPFDDLSRLGRFHVVQLSGPCEGPR